MLAVVVVVVAAAAAAAAAAASLQNLGIYLYERLVTATRAAQPDTCVLQVPPPRPHPPERAARHRVGINPKKGKLEVEKPEKESALSAQSTQSARVQGVVGCEWGKGLAKDGGGCWRGPGVMVVLD